MSCLMHGVERAELDAESALGLGLDGSVSVFGDVFRKLDFFDFPVYSEETRARFLRKMRREKEKDWWESEES